MEKTNNDPFDEYSIRQIVGGVLDWVQTTLKDSIKYFLDEGNPPNDVKFDLNLVNSTNFMKRQVRQVGSHHMYQLLCLPL